MADAPAQRTIVLMNQKGGVGKTTTAANLGAALAELDRRVLLIDLDPQAHLTLHLGIDPVALDRSVYDLLLDEGLSAAETMHAVGETLWVLPSEVNLAAAESELATRPDRRSLLQRKLERVRADFDAILVDCPPSLGLLTINALAAVEEVVVPLQSHFMALQGLSKLLETVQLVRGQINPGLRVGGIVLCMHEAQTNLATEVRRDLEQFLAANRGTAVPWSDAVLHEPPIRRNIKLAEAPSFGQTIFQYAPWCAGASDYRRLAEQLVAARGDGTSHGSPAEKPVDRAPGSGPGP